jgi:hypothetical protein
MAENQNDKYSTLANRINGVEASTNSTNSELRLLDICRGQLPTSLCDTIGKVVRDKGIDIGGNPKAIMQPMLKFDKSGKVIGGSINITVRF